MKNLVMILFWICLLSSCEKEEIKNSKQKIDVFLCIGQSNMSGRAFLKDNDTLTQNNLFLLNTKNKWELAKNPLNKHSNIRQELHRQHLGPSWSFGKQLNAFNKIGLIVNARGGISIDQFNRDSIFYKKTIFRTKEALKSGGIIKGVIWHQGENDINNWKEYREKLIKLINNIRTDLNAPNLIFISGEIGNWKLENRINSDSLNKVIRNININNYDFVSAENLSPQTIDSIHFDRQSQLILGKRYAKKYLDMIK